MDDFGGKNPLFFGNTLILNPPEICREIFLKPKNRPCFDKLMGMVFRHVVGWQNPGFSSGRKMGSTFGIEKRLPRNFGTFLDVHGSDRN